MASFRPACPTSWPPPPLFFSSTDRVVSTWGLQATQGSCPLIQVFSSFLAQPRTSGAGRSLPGGSAPPSAPSSAHLSLNSLREVAAFASRLPQLRGCGNAWDSPSSRSPSACSTEHRKVERGLLSGAFLALEPPRARLLTNFDLSSSSDGTLSFSSSKATLSSRKHPVQYLGYLSSSSRL